MIPAIHLQDVTKFYGNTLALDRLSLTVDQGEIYGFIGPNGAGKSTAIRLLLNFIQAQSGNIRVLGLTPERDDVAIKRQTGYVSAEAFLYPDMRVSDLFQFTSSFHGIKPDDKIRRLVEALEIDTQKRFQALSFGNRKKVAIACALLHAPKLIVLDEPSNGLDPVIRGNLYEILKDEQRNGATIFFSSHVLAEVQMVSTRIGLIKGGRMIKEAPAAEFTRIGYRKVNLETPADLNLGGLPGVADLRREGNHFRFLYSGEPNDLIRCLSAFSIDAITIEEPDLESVFLHYFTHPTT